MTTTFTNGGDGYTHASAEKTALLAARRGDLTYADLGIAPDDISEVRNRINSLVATVPEEYRELGVVADNILRSSSTTLEGKEVAQLMHNFVTGEGPNEYSYDASSPLTKSMMTTDSTERNWQLFLSTRKEQIRFGGTVAPYEGAGAWGFNTKNGIDAMQNGIDAMLDATYPETNPTRHFVGSYDVDISDNGNGTATVAIMNETSVTSFTRGFFSGDKRIESYNRVPNSYGLTTPYGTIKQTFSEVRPYPAWVFDAQGKK